MIQTYCDWHLGDNLVHLNFLRRIAIANPDREFVHAALPEYQWQLRPILKDVPNARVTDARSGDGWINAWKNSDDFFTKHPNGGRFVEFHIDHFKRIASQMGLESQVKCADDFLFNYPDLLEPAWPGCRFDFLIINSRPMSGQLCAYRENFFDPLMKRLVAEGRQVAATQDTGVPGVRYTKPLSVTELGNLSMRCRNIVGVATGPAWTTYNIWSRPSKRVMLLDRQERLDITPDTVQCNSEGEMMAALNL